MSFRRMVQPYYLTCLCTDVVAERERVRRTSAAGVPLPPPLARCSSERGAIRGELTRHLQYSIPGTTNWTLIWLKHTVYETKGLPLTNELLIGSDRCRVRVRVSQIRLVHRVRQPFVE